MHLHLNLHLYQHLHLHLYQHLHLHLHLYLHPREALVSMGNDVHLLDKWYRKDSNKTPAESILLPITTHLIHFLNKVGG